MGSEEWLSGAASKNWDDPGSVPKGMMVGWEDSTLFGTLGRGSGQVFTLKC